MIKLFDLCCGGEEETRKLSALTAPFSDIDEDELRRVQSQQSTKEHIRQIEHQISLLNKIRSKSRNTVTGKEICSIKACNYTPPIHQKSPEDMEFLVNYLKHNFLFEELSEDEMTQLAMAMELEEVQAGTLIFRKGEKGGCLYVCQEGAVEYYDHDTIVGGFSTGESFGELALLYDADRIATCKAKSFTRLWKVDQLTFRYILAHNTHKQSTSLKALIRSIEVFSGLDERSLNRFIHSLAVVHWKAGQRIVEKGEEGNIFYIITKGQVRVHDIGLGDSQYQDQILSVGESFGERALITDEPRAARVTAVSDVTTMAIDRRTFEETVGPLRELMEREVRRKSLRSLPSIQNSKLTDPEIDNLVDLMKELCYKKGEFLAESGKPYMMNLWIIRHGTLLVYSSKNPEKIYNLQSGDYFGDKSITGDPENIGSHTAVCEENLTTWVLTRADIEHVIGDISRLGSTVDFERSTQDQSILLSHLKRLRVLGQGAFGRVWLVSHRDTDQSYALKVISKHKLIESQQVQSVLREKDMLCLLRHPLILHLVSSYQDENNLYFLLPVIQGGELYTQLQNTSLRGRGMRPAHAAFYAACIIEALGHFHQRRIAYRDLKLENILLDRDGYCVVIDLGFAKVVTDKTFTLVGTPEYLAPEIIMSKGHNHAVDYWSYGVILYELLCGRSPFWKKGSKQMDMFKRIVLVQYELPDYLGEQEKSLIRGLLVRQQANRLGNLANGYVGIKRHEWFKSNDIDFRSIHNKQVEAPWKPKATENPMDLAENFDDYSFLKEDVRHSKLTDSQQELFAAF